MEQRWISSFKHISNQQQIGSWHLQGPSSPFIKPRFDQIGHLNLHFNPSLVHMKIYSTKFQKRTRLRSCGENENDLIFVGSKFNPLSREAISKEKKTTGRISSVLGTRALPPIQSQLVQSRARLLWKINLFCLAMSTSTYRQEHSADVHRSRRGATNSINSVKPRRRIQEHQRRLLYDRSQILFKKSVHLRGYYSGVEMDQLRHWYPDLILGIKKGLEKSVFSREKTKTSNSCTRSIKSIIGMDREQTKQRLLLETYRNIFDCEINYCIVYDCFRQFLTEHQSLTQFSDVTSDPLTLMVNSAMEYARYTEHKANLRSDLSQSKSHLHE